MLIPEEIPEEIKNQVSAQTWHQNSNTLPHPDLRLNAKF